MDPIQIGQLIKSKYPDAYSQYPDELIGKKWMEKNMKSTGGTTVNPSAYLSQQQQQQPSQFQNILEYNAALGGKPSLSNFVSGGTPEIKTDLSGSAKAGGLATNTATAGSMTGASPSSVTQSDGKWVFQPVVDWFKGFGAPKTEQPLNLTSVLQRRAQ